MDVISALEPFAWPDQKPVLPGYCGAKAIAGRMGSVVFIATQDHDGQVEVSLAAFDGGKRPLTPSKRCSKGQADWFFRQLGIEPIEAVTMPSTRHFVVVRGAVQ